MVLKVLVALVYTSHVLVVVLNDDGDWHIMLFIATCWWILALTLDGIDGMPRKASREGRYNRVVIPAAIYDCWVFLSQIVSFPPWSIFLLQTGLDSDDIFWGALAVCPESACGSYPILQQFMEKDWWTIKIITIHFVVLVAVVLHQIGNSLKAQPLITPLTLNFP